MLDLLSIMTMTYSIPLPVKEKKMEVVYRKLHPNGKYVTSQSKDFIVIKCTAGKEWHGWREISNNALTPQQNESAVKSHQVQ